MENWLVERGNATGAKGRGTAIGTGVLEKISEIENMEIRNVAGVELALQDAGLGEVAEGEAEQGRMIAELFCVNFFLKNFSRKKSSGAVGEQAGERMKWRWGREGL